NATAEPEISEANKAILDQVNKLAENNGVKAFEGARVIDGVVTLRDGRSVTQDGDGLKVGSNAANQGNFTIKKDALDALNGRPIVSDLEAGRLNKAVAAGLNLSKNGKNDLTL